MVITYAVSGIGTTAPVAVLGGHCRTVLATLRASPGDDLSRQKTIVILSQ